MQHQLQQQQQQRQQTAVEAGLQDLQDAFKQLWKLPWENQRKELFWRLALDGLPTAERMHTGEPCQCGEAVAPGRQHHFWECPVAVSVRQELQAQLAPGAAELQCADLWLVRPVPSVHYGVWKVVCLAAMNAMDAGRRTLRKLDGAQQVSEAARAAPVVVPVLVAQRVAVAHFWALLQDFCVLASVPKRWFSWLDVDHPFLSRASPAAFALTVNRAST
jgi:hypothetical protein